MLRKKVFISYNHRQGNWVWDRLVPILKAGGAQVLIDRERFEAGRDLVAQIDTTQDEADINVLVLSPEYLTSQPCLHEMKRAISRDPRFETGAVVSIKRVEMRVPQALRKALYVNLIADDNVDQWDLLLQSCDADVGTAAPEWLAARDETRRLLQRGQSVNLLVDGKVAWRELLADLQGNNLGGLVQVDLEMGTTASRRGLTIEILRALGLKSPVPPEPDDLGVLHTLLAERSRSLLALTHFDLAARRPAYGIDLFSALRYLVMETRHLVLLVQSRQSFASLLPANHPLSAIDLQVVELRGR
jgi:hypothetical protein